MSLNAEDPRTSLYLSALVFHWGRLSARCYYIFGAADRENTNETDLGENVVNEKE